MKTVYFINPNQIAIAILVDGHIDKDFLYTPSIRFFNYPVTTEYWEHEGRKYLKDHIKDSDAIRFKGGDKYNIWRNPKLVLKLSSGDTITKYDKNRAVLVTILDYLNKVNSSIQISI